MKGLGCGPHVSQGLQCLHIADAVAMLQVRRWMWLEIQAGSCQAYMRKQDRLRAEGHAAEPALSALLHAKAFVALGLTRQVRWPPWGQRCI